MIDNIDDPRVLQLTLLGTKVSVICRSNECYLGIKEHFKPHCVEELHRTPDFIIECDWPQAGRYLFRARPEAEAQVPLAGVRVRCLGQDETKEWLGASPPLPPFRLPPLQNRFVGLHGACVALDSGPVIVLVGPRGSGKTTLSAKLVNEVGGDFLSDEVTCIHTRSMVVSPFAMAMGITAIGTDGQLSKDAVAADRVVKRVATKAHSVTAGVILNSKGISASALRPLSQQEAFRLLLTQHLDLGTDLGECLTTLADLSLEVPFVELTYAGYPQIEHAVMNLASFALAGEC